MRSHTEAWFTAALAFTSAFTTATWPFWLATNSGVHPSVCPKRQTRAHAYARFSLSPLLTSSPLECVAPETCAHTTLDKQH